MYWRQRGVSWFHQFSMALYGPVNCSRRSVNSVLCENRARIDSDGQSKPIKRNFSPLTVALQFTTSPSNPLSNWITYPVLWQFRLHVHCTRCNRFIWLLYPNSSSTLHFHYYWFLLLHIILYYCCLPTQTIKFSLHASFWLSSTVTHPFRDTSFSLQLLFTLCFLFYSLSFCFLFLVPIVIGRWYYYMCSGCAALNLDNTNRRPPTTHRPPSSSNECYHHTCMVIGFSGDDTERFKSNTSTNQST